MTTPRTQDFQRQIEALAEVDWRHPAWATVAWVAGWKGSARTEAASRDYREANSGPHADTFMAVPRAPASEDSADPVTAALHRAQVALQAIRQLDGTLPGQPLGCALGLKRGWARPQILPQEPRAAFVCPRGAWVADLASAAPGALAPGLTVALAERGEPPSWLRRIDPSAATPTPAAVAVAVGRMGLEEARHLHRRAWTRGGGPWLGLAQTAELDVLSTCHVAVDGYGHGLLSRSILPFGATPALGGDAGSRLPPGSVDDFPTSAPSHFAFTYRRITGGVGAFPRQAYAFGRALQRVFGASAARSRFSPTFQVPMAGGEAGDPQRRRRRVEHALLSIRRNGEDFEPFAEFSHRLRELRKSSHLRSGALSRLARGIAGSPLPAALRQRLLRTHRPPHPWLPPTAVLRGRGRLSSVRFAPREEPPCPLYAASAPPLLASDRDPRGSVTLTLIHHPESCSVSLFGTGLAGNREGGERFLDAWLEELAHC